MTVSETGLLAAWNILVKGTLGVVAAIIAGRHHAVTRPAASGCSGCTCPDCSSQIATFMVRYLEVVGGEMRRMRMARESRGFDAQQPAALRVARPVRRGAVHPLLRARRARAPGDAEPRATPDRCP